MNGRASIIASPALLIASACVMGFVLARWHSASDDLHRAKAALVSVQQQAREVRSLQATLDTQRIATTGSRADALAEIATA